MAISKKEVEHLAKLARIDLSKEEIEKFQNQLSSILDYVAKLKKVDLNKKDASFRKSKIQNVSRSDQKKSSTKQKRLLKQAPDQQDDFYKVKEVFK